MGPTRCTPVSLSYKGSEGGSNLGPVANNVENIASGSQSWGSGHGIFDLVGCNRSCQNLGLGRLHGAY